MNKTNLFLGGWATALTNVVAMLSVGDDKFIKSGFILGMLAIFLLFNVIAIGIVNTVGDKNAVKWGNYFSFLLGSAISTGVTIAMYLLGIA